MSNLLRHFTRLIPKKICSSRPLRLTFGGPKTIQTSYICRRSMANSSHPPDNSSHLQQQQDPVGTALLDMVTYESICAETLEALCEYFDELVEASTHLKNTDITYSVSHYIQSKFYPN